MVTAALEGIRVLDLTRVLAGPYCSMILGDLGAEIIKVEAPGGSDETRTWGPPFKEGVSAYYLCTNRNKKSLTLDLKSREGKEVLEKLVRESDVVLNNFKTGTMERLGFEYDHIKEINPRIVFCSITGFGETGPYQQLPGYDFIIQAMSGLMSITGDDQSGPQKLGVAITDILTGLYACIGIQTALLERERSGYGQKIDLSLYDAAVSSLINIGSNFLMTGKVPQRLGNHHANIVPYQTFRSRDGEMVIAVGNDRQFAHLCAVVGQPSLASDPLFSTNAKRVENREALSYILQELFSQEKTAYWQDRCQEKHIPFGPIQTLEDVRNDEQLKARDMFLNLEHPKAGNVEMIGSPLKLSRTPVDYKQHPPDAGEHTEEILTGLGYDKNTIRKWKKDHKV